MNPKTAYRLTSRQIAQLALSVLVIYYPILLYVNLPERNWPFLVQSLPFLLGQGVVTFAIYYVWIYITEIILDRTSIRFGEEFLVDFKLPMQVLALLLAITAGLVLNLAGDQARHQLVRYIPRPEVGSHRPASKRQSTDEPPNRPHRWEFFERSNNGLSIVIMLSIFYLSANRRANRRLKDIQIRAERLEKEAVLTQFAALKNQISPHFLFNSLSILSSLVHVDADLSEQFIDQLSRAYRYILEQKDNDKVRLKTELDFIRSYTFLLKIRFEDSFDVLIDIPEKTVDQYCIAPLTLQLLVENAVKHNRMTPEMPQQVWIKTEGEYLVVSNRIQPREQLEHSTGVGLQNIINRYALLTDQPVWVGEQDGAFVVKIPLIA
ncbi:sensor histidine kinase [Larkinella humicola]|uniref:Histidine kinase n=1 Tax=Larkinella humicola TaxID=2607654 RepID=A0A5N1JLW3_9BACT|nr:histidine kinase [Larkinella humicola]KAA9357184.1 histidine kinase [Larkinella humicola]